jgi:fructokinase
MILCCGEALIDMIPAPTDRGRDGFVPYPGGAVFNTAIALGRLGVPAGLLTGLSRDLFGAQLAAALHDSGVDTALAIRTDRPTTLAFVELAHGDARYHFFDENSAGRMLEPADMPDLPDHVTSLFLGGISMACEPGADAYAALLARAGEARAVMIDPNIRPGFIADAARYRQRLAAMLARADIVKLSGEDLGWLAPGDDPEAARIARLLARGPALAIVTRGGDGATAYLTGGAVVSVPARATRIVDTVGAGDTFNAGVLAKLAALGLLTRPALRQLDPEAARAALTLGARAAAVTVSRPGADPPWAADLPD